jgi:hypothetical protein
MTGVGRSLVPGSHVSAADAPIGRPSSRGLHGQLSLLVPGIPCALATHALLYRSLRPSDAVHGYFGWYEPLVGVLSLLAVVGLCVLGLAAVFGRDVRMRGLVRRAAAAHGLRPALLWRRVALMALLVLVVQESVERSVATGSPGLAVFSASSWLTILIGVLLFAGVVALVARGSVAFVRAALCSAIAAVPRAAVRAVAPGPRARWRRRRSPLGLRRGLRAPPLLAG